MRWTRRTTRACRTASPESRPRFSEVRVAVPPIVIRSEARIAGAAHPRVERPAQRAFRGRILLVGGEVAHLAWIGLDVVELFGGPLRRREREVTRDRWIRTPREQQLLGR